VTAAAPEPLDPERQRQNEGMKWMVWGPYLSERQWGTVREDYSPGGDAWEYFPYEHARSRAYRWGEDGIGGFSDYRSRVCVGLALWNGRDPILKERMFGLSNGEGNHGEDVKELFYYLDATPTHSYLRMLYKYPQAAFPYAGLLAENRRRSRADPEFELIDTGIFDQDRYFDVFIEYAKAAPDDIRMRVTLHNRGAEAADIHVLPHIWFRNTWSWTKDAARPELTLDRPGTVRVEHPEIGSFRFDAVAAPDIYFCENETNAARVFGTAPVAGYFKDAIHDRVVGGARDAVNPAARGTKAAAHYFFQVPAGGHVTVHTRLRGSGHDPRCDDGDAVVESRRAEADRFYAVLQDGNADADQRLVQRQALAGMIWSKQFYYYDIDNWLTGDPAQPPPPDTRTRGRNADWRHLNNADVISMPDKWEYPWYAAWDLAFHCLPLAMVDAGFAKRQLLLMTREWYMHPNGQLPAYEWALGDVNPPVHAWASWRVFQIDRKQRGDSGDLRFLERVFHKLVINFTWWVNRKDAAGNNVFHGGFLGLDNIGLFDRSSPLPGGCHISQSDGTSWMAMYSLNLMRIALELARHNDTYEDIASKFFEHFLHIAGAMATAGEAGLWDEEDAFYYDWLEMSNPRRRMPLRVRSMVGLIPLFAVEVLEADVLDQLPGFRKRMEWFLNSRKDLYDLVSHWEVPGVGQRRLLSLLRGRRMKALLRRMLDEQEFLSPYGVRALSRVHLAQPVHLEHGGERFTVRYAPGEAETGLFGGNANWRGPIWMPVNYLLIESLQKFHHYYGPDFTVDCPVGSGQKLTLLEVSEEVSRRVLGVFARDANGRRPLFGDVEKFQSDPHFRDYVLFHEYFHGDTGRGLGASHQTGWTGLVARLIQPRRTQ
jgi:hypothetical protein